MDDSSLIQIEEVKAHLNLDHDLDNDLLRTYILASLEVAQRHIGKTFSDTATESTVPFNQSIKVGCLLYIGHLYANRELTTDSQQFLIPMGVKSLWETYREVGIY